MHSQSPSSTQEKQLQILVVDDEKMLAWTLGMLLTKVGYDVMTFNNPILALEELRQRPADLVLSDVVMPEMSGIDLAIDIRKEQPDCQIVLLSGQAATVQLLEKAKAQGYDFEVFPKPFAPRELLKFVEDRIGMPRALSPVA